MDVSKVRLSGRMKFEMRWGRGLPDFSALLFSGFKLLICNKLLLTMNGVQRLYDIFQL